MRAAYLVLSALCFASTPSLAQISVSTVQPSKLDGVKSYDEPNVVITNRGVKDDAPLVIFLPGTDGRPQKVVPLLKFVANRGYPVIGLEYNDEPSVSKVCPRDPDPACSAAFRQMRLDGTGTARISNSVAESITARLSALLTYLRDTAPHDNWGQYLDADGQPKWERIAVSGLSQGAGMAAFIAKQHKVARVVLFSSPWDVTGADKHPAPWISAPSATPPALWYAEYNGHENTAKLIKNAYAALQIPADHIRVFDLDLPAGVNPGNDNPYHGITVHDPRYKPDWAFLYGP